MSLRIVKLGNILEEISIEQFKNLEELRLQRPEKVDENELDEVGKAKIARNKKIAKSKSFSAVLIADAEHATKAMHLAQMQYEGEINLHSIEFCKVETQQECIAGTLSIPYLTDITNSKFCMQFFINPRHIVIIDDDGFAEMILRRICQKRNNQGANRELFLYNFLTQFISQDLETMGRMERQIMQMEDDVMEGEIEDFQEKIAPLRKDLLILREYYDELCDLGRELEEDENVFFKKKHLKYFGIFSDRADRLMGRAKHLLDYLGQVRDAYQEKVAEEQNKNMEFLTIISTIFFPLTLITGWYGMNFQNMPELTNGYPFVIVLSLLVILIIIYIFKKKKIF